MVRSQQQQLPVLGGSQKLHLRHLSNGSMQACAPVLIDGGSASAAHGGGLLLVCPYAERLRVFSLGLSKPTDNSANSAAASCEQPWRELHGHTSTVCGLVADATQPLHVHSVSCADPEVLTWNVITGAIVQRRPIHSQPLGLLSTKKFGLLVVLSCKEAGGATGASVWRLDEETSKPLVKLAHADARTWAMGAQDAFLASTALDKKHLQLSELPSGKLISLKSDVRIRCLATHPTEECVATGLSNGRILLWWNVMNSRYEQTAPLRSLLHWHSVEVNCVRFSPDGASLFSGGAEAVLVRWDLTAEGVKADYLPRLGSSLQQLASTPDGSVLAVTLSHNEVLALESTFKPLARLRGVTHLVESGLSGAHVGLVMDPRSGAVVTNGFPGQLQCMNVHLDIALEGLDVTQENYMSVAPSKSAALHRVKIECIAFSADGTWLATFERRQDRRLPEHRLRLWKRGAGPADAGFQQHSVKQLAAFRHVRQLAFRPGASTSELLASTAAGELMLWRCETTLVAVSVPNGQPEQPPIQQINWRQARTWSLSPDHRGGPCAFDAGGEHLVSGHGQQAAVWSWAQLSAVPRVLSTPCADADAKCADTDLNNVFFWRHRDQPQSHVVTCSPSGAAVWPPAPASQPCVAVDQQVRAALVAPGTGCLVLLCAAPNAVLVVSEVDCARGSFKAMELAVCPVAACLAGPTTLVCLTDAAGLCVFEQDDAGSAHLRQAWRLEQLEARCAALPKSNAGQGVRDNWLLKKLDLSQSELGAGALAAALPRSVSHHRDLLLKRIESLRTDQPFSAPLPQRLVGELLDAQLRTVLHLEQQEEPAGASDDSGDECGLVSMSPDPVEEEEEDEQVVPDKKNSAPAVPLEQWDKFLTCSGADGAATLSHKKRRRSRPQPSSPAAANASADDCADSSDKKSKKKRKRKSSSSSSSFDHRILTPVVVT